MIQRRFTVFKISTNGTLPIYLDTKTCNRFSIVDVIGSIYICIYYTTIILLLTLKTSIEFNSIFNVPTNALKVISMCIIHAIY